MNREVQLQFCRFCVNQKISIKDGIICPGVVLVQTYKSKSV
jgi:hypothetical protein